MRRTAFERGFSIVPRGWRRSGATGRPGPRLRRLCGEALEDRRLLAAVPLGDAALPAVVAADAGSLLADRIEPVTIRVGAYPSGPATTVPFDDYVQDVVPNEWPAAWAWPAEAYKAAAMAVKTYAWHKLDSPVSDAFDIFNDTHSQRYVAGSSLSASAVEYTDPAVAAVRAVGMERADGQLFASQYWDGRCDVASPGGATLRSSPTAADDTNVVATLANATRVYAIDSGEHFADGQRWFQVAVDGVSPGTTTYVGYLPASSLTGVSLGGRSVAIMEGRLSQYGTVYWANQNWDYQQILSYFYDGSSSAAGQDVGFFHIRIAGIPTVTTLAATDVSASAATLRGQIADNGQATISEEQFRWGTTADCTDGFTSVVAADGDQFSCALAGLTPGRTYYFQARARNVAGWGDGQTLSFVAAASLPADTTPPGLAIAAPADNATVTTANLTLSGTASDGGRGASGVTSVTVNGVAAAGGTATGAGTANWNATLALYPGANTITVVATDGRGNAAQRQITVNYSAAETAGPALAIAAPADGATVTGASLTVSGTASDAGRGNNGVAAITVNGVAAGGGSATEAGTANWTAAVTLHSGANTITVVATDALGNATQQQLTITYNPPLPAITIVDDKDLGFAATGAWAAANDQGYHGGVHFAAWNSGAEAAWTFHVAPGWYRISATWSANTNRATNAPYHIVDGATELDTVRVNQRLTPAGLDDGGTWKPLGTYEIAGDTLTVRLASDADNYVIADAVRIDAVAAPDPTRTIILGDSGQGFRTTGAWQSALGLGRDGDVRFAAGGGSAKVATWTADVAPGWYKVDAAWTANPNRATNAPYTILDGAAALGTVRVNQQLAPADAAAAFTGAASAGDAWKPLGTYHVTGTKLVVQLSNQGANGWVVADAVRIAPAAGPAYPLVIGDGDPGFAASGTWWTISNQGFGGDVSYALGAGADAATWTFPVATPGQYQVDVTWTADPNRATNAPYSVYDGTTLLATVTVNQRQTPDQVAEGGVRYHALGVYTVSGNTLTVRLTDAADSWVIADAVGIQRVEGLLVDAAAAPSGGSLALAPRQLAPLADEAIRRWTAAEGASAAAKLATVKFEIADLPPGVLGEAADGVVRIDRDAAGYGWFVDPTPREDEEFAGQKGTVPFSSDENWDSPRAGRVDLLTAVMHELGHELGLGHTAADGLMDASLPLGTRRA